MANEISKLKVPVLGAEDQVTMEVYNIKDSTARTDAAAALAAAQAADVAAKAAQSAAEAAQKTAQDALGGGISVSTPVASLDEITSPEENKIYLVGEGTGDEGNVYEEYMYIGDKFELIGSTAVDLDGYVTEDTLGDALSDGYKPEGSNAASEVTITPTTTSVYSMTSAGSTTPGSAAEFDVSIEDEETLVLNFVPNVPTVVTLPGRSQVSGLWNGVSAATAAAQDFTGTSIVSK